MKIDTSVLKIKKLDISSIPALLDIQEEAFEYANGDTDFLRRNTVETFTPCFDDPSVVLGVFHEENMIAFGILYCAGETEENLAKDIDEVEDLTDNANLKLTIVRPDYRGNGLQRLLILELEKYAKESGFTYLSTTVSPGNPWSLNNCKKCGYTEVKILQKYGGLTRVLLAKKIK